MTAKRYGLWGETCRDFLSWHGKVIVHTSKPELEFLVVGCPVREVPASIRPEDTIPIAAHPQFASVQWPLDRRHFR